MTDFPPEKAQEYYKRGMELKAQGNNEAALTEFRRAALADPNQFEAQYEIGVLCKVKANTDRLFLRYAFDAFRKAARLNLNHQQTHEQYIMVGQKLGLIEELHREYDTLAKNNPENALLQQSAKNIVTLSMAMMPDPVNINDGGLAGSIRKVVLFIAIGFILMGAGLILGPTIVKKTSKPDMPPEMIVRLAKIGFLCGAAGIVTFIVRAKLAKV
jgi:tetratricopeptide (TPR) repeat protein